VESFDVKGPTEAVVLTFNFAQALQDLNGILLAGVPVVTFANVYGGDPNPSALANGPVAIDPTGTLVWVPVAGGIDQNNYLIVVECPTTSLEWALTLPAILPVRAYPSAAGAP
jgi:hypothetical protein